MKEPNRYLPMNRAELIAECESLRAGGHITRVIVSARDGILFDSKHDGKEWTCGRCWRGTLKPVVGEQCTNCTARVSVIVDKPV